MNRGIPGVLARGGSSRGLLIMWDDLKAVPAEQWESLFALWVGSPDPSGRQVNGAGGGNPSTSKVVVLGASDVSGRDLDYTFFQIDPITGASERRGTCGNLTAAVGLLAASEDLVTLTSPTTVVRLRDTNTGQDIDVAVPLASVPRSTQIAKATYQTATTCPPIISTFREPGGATTRSLFPTGNPHDEIEIDGRALTVTLIDAVNPVVLVDGLSLGVDPERSPGDLEADAELMATLERVRSWAAVQCGFASSIATVPEESSYLPYVGMIFPPQDYTASNGTRVARDEVDVVVRMLSGATVHRALPLSAGLATAAAASLIAAEPTAGEIRLGHPSGVLRAQVASTREDGSHVHSISVESTARIIMRGYLEVD
jgi:2-methylaconitate cis-trans-isomerase PrpF